MKIQYKSIHGVDLQIHGDMVVLADKREGSFEAQTFTYFQMVIDKLSIYHSRPLVFADIGAYTGIYSIYAAMKGLKVEAFEPHPKVYNRLRANIDHNYEKVGGWSGEIRHHNCAISDSAREALFHHNNNVELTSGGSIDLLSISNIVNKTDDFMYKVVTDTYNNLLYQRPDIVKIDVEGHELSVLRGMECLHDNKYKPFIITEANYYDKYCEMKEYLLERDYDLVDMLDNRNMVFAPKMLQFVNE